MKNCKETVKTFGLYSKGEQRHPWVYLSSSKPTKNSWLCKICEQYAETEDKFFKIKVPAHDDHPGNMFQLHLHRGKHKKATDRKHVLHSLLRKGNIKAHIITEAKNCEILKREHNRRVISKFVKTIYFICRKKRASKNNFHHLMEHIENFQAIDKNATYLSKFTVQEFVKICNNYMVDIFLNNIVFAGEFAILTHRPTDHLPLIH